MSTSPFLDPGFKTEANKLAIALLSRDNLQPITLEQSTGAVDGYAEGATINTRFGSFPHSTLLDVPWGSQVRASVVDTGSRGQKRKRAAAGADTDSAAPSQEEDDRKSVSAPAKKAIAASSGFIHILRPTPELWTSSLPHRTQVVYTPDYSYILHRIRARPGSRLIEAGSGSGSFTHASVRAVYNGIAQDPSENRGKVFSFEFNEARYHKMTQEVKAHSLEDMVQMAHRNVYEDGFLMDGKSPQASAVFLDLPAPWEALHHLSRRQQPSQADDTNGQSEWTSPLDPKQTVHICTFSPCIEQVTRTVEELRAQGWVDIDMVEIANKKLNVSRERVGVDLPNERGFNPSPADVGEAVTRLKELNYKTQVFNKAQSSRGGTDSPAVEMDVDSPAPTPAMSRSSSKNGIAKKTEFDEDRAWMHGRLFHRTEGEIKTHTSYLVFAVLPREWDEEAEQAAFAKWPCGNERRTIGNLDKEARKQEKRETLFTKKPRRKFDTQSQAAAAS